MHNAVFLLQGSKNSFYYLSMRILEIFTFVIYFVVLISLVFITHRKQRSDTDFVIGNRSLNFYVTALAAHASEMGFWLFLGYPGKIFLNGIFMIWVPIGLLVFMFLNWQFIAPKIRVATEKMKNLTLNSYFESRYNDTSGLLRTISGIATFVFFLCYLAAGLVAMGNLVETLFGIDYFWGMTIGLFIVMFYVFFGGYSTVAWIDLFQGLFLLFVILVIPAILLPKLGGGPPIMEALKTQNLSTSLFPKFSALSILQIISLSCGWGLGYFGQPQIITKFMGIQKVNEMHKAKYVGMSWQALALFGATLIGLIGIFLFPQGLSNPERVILEVVQSSLTAFFAGLVLCAILAASTNVMAAQLLVVASSLSEDFYKRFLKKNASHKAVLKASRVSVIGVSIIAYFVAVIKTSPSVYLLVEYAWAGIGASFGPLLIASLYSKKPNKYGALAGLITGGVVSGFWPWVNIYFPIDIHPLLPGFICSFLAIFLVSFLSKHKRAV